MGNGWKPVMPLGWKPADDDNAEDADADDDAAGRFRLIFLVGTKRKSSMADLRPPLAPQRNSMWLGHKRLAGSLAMASVRLIIIEKVEKWLDHWKADPRLPRWI